jgi:hypothetical protein
MKKNLFFLTMILCISCTNVNKPLTSDEKDKVITEAKEFVSTIIQMCEKAESEKLKTLFLNSQDFVSMVGGVYEEYEQSLKSMDAYFANVTSQKANIKSEKYIVLDATTVLYSENSSWEVKLKNDSTIIMDPAGMQFLLKKVDDQWKVLSWTEEINVKK